jgi:hypothetical protein
VLKEVSGAFIASKGLIDVAPYLQKDAKNSLLRGTGPVRYPEYGV